MSSIRRTFVHKIDTINFSTGVEDKNKIGIVNNIFNRNSYCLNCRLVNESLDVLYNNTMIWVEVARFPWIGIRTNRGSNNALVHVYNYVKMDWWRPGIVIFTYNNVQDNRYIFIIIRPMLYYVYCLFAVSCPTIINGMDTLYYYGRVVII